MSKVINQVTPSSPVTLSPAVFQNLASLTAINDHGECYVEAAHALGLEELKTEFGYLNFYRERLGYMSSALLAKRRVLYEELLRQARLLLTPAQYKTLYCCF